MLNGFYKDKINLFKDVDSSKPQYDFSFLRDIANMNPDDFGLNKIDKDLREIVNALNNQLDHAIKESESARRDAKLSKIVSIASLVVAVVSAAVAIIALF